MRKALRWLSLSIFTGLGLFMLWFGYVYLIVQHMLWFHAAAVPEAHRADMLPLYLALMNLIGSSSLALGALGLLTTWTAVRAGSRLAASALAGAYAFTFVIAAITAEELAKSGAPTSWHIMGVLLAAALVGYGAHSIANRSRVGERFSAG